MDKIIGGIGLGIVVVYVLYSLYRCWKDDNWDHTKGSMYF